MLLSLHFPTLTGMSLLSSLSVPLLVQPLVTSHRIYCRSLPSNWLTCWSLPDLPQHFWAQNLERNPKVSVCTAWSPLLVPRPTLHHFPRHKYPPASMKALPFLRGSPCLDLASSACPAPCPDLLTTSFHPVGSSNCHLLCEAFRELEPPRLIRRPPLWPQSLCVDSSGQQHW